MDIVEFLRARYNTAEGVIRRLAELAEENAQLMSDLQQEAAAGALAPSVTLLMTDPVVGPFMRDVAEGRERMPSDGELLLEDIAAKRRVIDMLYGSADFYEAMPSPGYARPGHSPSVDVLIRVFQLFALPFAGHPDYRPEWKP